MTFIGNNYPATFDYYLRIIIYGSLSNSSLIAVAVVCVIAMFTTGAAVSIREEKSRLLLVIHQIAPILKTLSMGWTICLL
ncbi:MAG: hypothetical protein GQ562_09025 [Anaerolineales bacterium]|nr:hypothetical protein [Anaerolineales bacterium]